MFETVTLCPPDAVFGLTEEFKRDSNPDKVNLSVGVYRDEQGQTPVMRAVHHAEQRMLDEHQGHTYLPIDGLPGYNRSVAELIFGHDHPVIQQQRFATVQTPGGTAALRIAGEILKTSMRCLNHLDQQSYLVQSPANLPSCRSGVATIRLPRPARNRAGFCQRLSRC